MDIYVNIITFKDGRHGYGMHIVLNMDWVACINYRQINHLEF
jgi:hypothetical protein